MKIKDFCKCCSYDDYGWEIYIPNPNYDSKDCPDPSDKYHRIKVDDLCGVKDIFGEKEIDEDEGLFFEKDTERRTDPAGKMSWMSETLQAGRDPILHHRCPDPCGKR